MTESYKMGRYINLDNAEGGLLSGETQEQKGIGESWAEISGIRQKLDAFSQSLSTLQNVHAKQISSPDSDALNSEQETLTAALRMEGRILSRKIQDLSDSTEVRSDRSLINQAKALAERHRGLIGEWQEEERIWRGKVRARAERQLRIVKPDITEEEIDKSLSGDIGGTVFSQALVSSQRTTESMKAFRSVNERQEELRKIERTLTELAQMFSDMAMLVERQDEVITVIEKGAEDTHINMDLGVVELDRGVVIAVKTRRKRWICLGISVAIVIILIIVILIVLATHGVFSKKM